VPLVVERVARAADHVAVIPGTAVLFHERYSNRLHVLLNAFALWRAVHETVADKQYRLVLLEDLPFRYNVTDSPVRNATHRYRGEACGVADMPLARLLPTGVGCVRGTCTQAAAHLLA
jgi:hypothetical protein